MHRRVKSLAVLLLASLGLLAGVVVPAVAAVAADRASSVQASFPDKWEAWEAAYIDNPRLVVTIFENPLD
jgi:hypothetical protein